MGNRNISPVVLIIVIAVIVVLLGYGAYRAAVPPAPPRSSYTPGVPPWMEKGGQAQNGVHATPGGNAPAGQTH